MLPQDCRGYLAGVEPLRTTRAKTLFGMELPMSQALREKPEKGTPVQRTADTAEGLPPGPMDMTVDAANPQTAMTLFPADAEEMGVEQPSSLLYHLYEGLAGPPATAAAEAAAGACLETYGANSTAPLLVTAALAASAATDPTASSWSITEEAIFWHIKAQSWKTA